MIVAVGERAHWPELSWGGECEWKRGWSVEAALLTPAFRDGYGRLESLGFDPDAAVNLLPPQNTPGAFETKRAREIASEVHEIARSHGWKLALLGRRVCDAFQRGMEFGKLYWCWEGGHCADVLALPHPSGLSRYLNSTDNQRLIESSIRSFQRRK